MSILIKLLRRCYRSCTDAKFREDWGFCYPPYGWHETISPKLAKYVYWVFKPVAHSLARKNYVFSINNIYSALGHIYVELDFGLRLQQTGMIDSSKTLVYLWPKSPIGNAFKHAVTPPRFKIVLSGLLHILLYPLLLRYRFLAVDTAFSDWNHGMDTGERQFHSLSYRDSLERQRRYYDLLHQTVGFYPLARFHPGPQPDALRAFIRRDKYIVLQFKDRTANATFQPTNPETYLPVIRLMQSRGFAVVLAGRESMPACFKEAGVIDYANSHLASALNDYYLVRDATAVLSSGSGFTAVPKTLGVPVLIVNVWNFAYPSARRSIVIPAVLSQSGRMLSFREQYDYTIKYEMVLPNTDVGRSMVCHDADAELILTAWLELLDYAADDQWVDTDLQQQFRQSLSGYPISLAPTLVSEAFLRRHQSLL